MMRMKKIMLAVASCAVAGAFLCACGDGVDENKPIAEVQAEAAKLNKAQLKAKIEACKKAIESKKAEADKLAEKIAAKIAKDPLKADVKDLKERADKLATSISKIAEQQKAYVEAQLKAAE